MLIDKYNRVVDYLRISVTERCNFRCAYCMPDKPFSWVPHENLLSYEDMFEFIKVAIDEGIKKIRITGGEPLLRANLDYFISMIHNYAPQIDLAITTNGYLLPQCAKELKDAGLKRINISLDSLKPDIAAKIAGRDILDGVLAGIQKAKEVGLKIKINTVPLKGLNDNEMVDILNWCKKEGFQVRFIEYMANTHAKNIQGLNATQMKNNISKVYKFTKLPRVGSSPSQDYQLEDGYIFGIIEPHKDDFCKSCNRIRLSAEGLLIPCLYFEDALSIAQEVKQGNIKKATQILKKVIDNKPEKNKWSDGEISSRAFYETGG